MTFKEKFIMALLTQRYDYKIRGTLACYDRIVIQGTIPGICYAQGMTSFLGRKEGSDLLIWQINMNEKWNVKIKELPPPHD